ncbi:MAG: hypothetical protein KBG28_08340 [Kofleriaceae bacterium]|nr:hypothetical protein [Kofleriaceae bacterium]
MAEAAPDARADVSADLAELLRTSDELLREWEQLGEQVRAQVRREVSTLGQSLADAVDQATAAAAARSARRAEAACELAMAGAVGAGLDRLRQGVVQAEARIAAMARARDDGRRRHDRRLVMALVIVVLVQLGSTLWLAGRAGDARPEAPASTVSPGATGASRSGGPVDAGLDADPDPGADAGALTDAATAGAGADASRPADVATTPAPAPRPTPVPRRRGRRVDRQP